ncbi:restriction endonuclease subunit S [Salinarimonas ramus]|uniref:restriction endonuclease subunit S n=1 Tax=Salinarimonas ramus TaxID=690164 RepID=UPI00166C48CD|nr:restriction endonuclease subunit S [Salinarimonas ramus]
MPGKLGEYFDNRQEPGRAGLPVMSVTQHDGLVLRETIDRRTESTLAPEQHLLVRPGDIAYNMMRMWQGACGLADRDAMVSPAYVVLRPKPNVDPTFAYQLFKSERVLHLLWAYSHGLTEDRLRLYFDDFSSIPLTLPELPLQRSIGRVLQHWDTAIAQAQRLGELRERRLYGLLAHLIGMHQSGPLEPGWSREELGSLSQFKSGGTPDRSRAAFWGGDVPWVSAKDLKSFDLATSVEQLTSEGAAKITRVKAGAVLILVPGMGLFKDLPIGVAARELTFNQDVKALLPRRGLDPRFLAYALKASRKTLMDRVDSAGHGTGRLATDVLEGLPITFPAPPEQQTIVRVLDAATQELRQVSRLVEALAKEKRAALQRLLPVDGFDHSADCSRVGALA